MSTRSTIAMKTRAGYKSIYCHFDGCTVGNTLVTYYKNPAKIKMLLSLGNISSLGKDIGKKHNFSMSYKEHPDWTNVYGRDRGEKGVLAKNIKNLELLKNHAIDVGANYLYVFEKGKWHMVKL